MCTHTARVDERRRSAPSKAQRPHPGTEQWEGCWGDESSGAGGSKGCLLRVSSEGLVSVIKKIHVLLTHLWP